MLRFQAAHALRKHECNKTQMSCAIPSKIIQTTANTTQHNATQHHCDAKIQTMKKQQAITTFRHSSFRKSPLVDSPRAMIARGPWFFQSRCRDAASILSTPRCATDLEFQNPLPYSGAHRPFREWRGRHRPRCTLPRCRSLSLL